MNIVTTSNWNQCKFGRNEEGGYKLSGFPTVAYDRVLARLFTLGAEFLAAGSVMETGEPWVKFQADRWLAGKLAKLFKADGDPLVVSEKGCLLSGFAEKKALSSKSFKGVIQGT